MATYTFGPFRLDTEAAILFRRGEPVSLGRRAVGVLRVLVERSADPVSKDALIETVWAGLSVEESNLTVQIAAVRRVLSEAPGGERWIETLPRRGYRFVGPIVAQEENVVIASAPPSGATRDSPPAKHDEAEHRQITAMSCEAVGAAARAVLEDLYEGIGAFHRCVSEIVGRHSGFIASRLGNSVLVLFGYPAAHEHDAEQAVRAGLELCVAVRTLRPGADAPMRCRVGIATGMVVVGDLAGVGEGGDHGIVGDAPDLAARLQVSAQPDTVTIESATRRLIGNLFDCRDLGALDTNSDTEPMRRWQVPGESVVASRFEAFHGSELTRLVGRDEEIDLLLRRWARAKVGDGQIVLVSGEPGLGKSRITVALEERLGAEPHLRLRYFCSPYHQDSALFPFVEQLGHAAGFARTTCPPPGWRSSRPCSPAPRRRTRMWRS